MSPSAQEEENKPNLHEVIGRKAVEIEEAHAVQRELLNIISGIKTGQINIDQVVVDLAANRCSVAPCDQDDSPPAEVS